MGIRKHAQPRNRCLPGVIALSMLTPLAVPPAGYAADAPMPIKRIWVNPEQQLMVEFVSPSGAFPSKPKVQDFPGTNHRLVLDFSDAVIDREQIAPAKDTLAVLTKAYPSIKGLRYAALTNTATPTARIVLDLPETVKANPHVVKLEANSVTIDLGFEGGGAAEVTEKGNAETPPVASSSPPAVSPTPGAVTPTPGAVIPTPTSTTSAVTEPGRERIAAPTTTASDEVKGTSTPASTESSKPAEIAATPSGTAPAAVDTSLQSKPESTNTLAPTKSNDSASSIFGSSQLPGGTTTPTAESNPLGLRSDLSSSKPPETPASSTLAKPASPEVSGLPTESSSTLPSTSKPDSILGTPGIAQAKDSTEKTGDQVASITPTPDATAASAAITTPGEDTKRQYAEAVRHYNQGYELHKSNKLTAAIAEYQAAITANPSLSQAYSNLGMIYNQQHNYKEALTEFRKALAIDPKDAITYNGIGAALRAQKDLAGAIKNWQTAVTLDPKLATAHYNLGTAYEIQRDYDKALDCYKQAVKNDYRLGEAYYRMGLILQKRNNLEGALEQFNQALKVSTKAEYSQDAHQRIALLSERKSTRK